VLDPELKATIIRILAGLEKSIEDTRESLNGGTYLVSGQNRKWYNRDAKPTGCNDHKYGRTRGTNK